MLSYVVTSRVKINRDTAVPGVIAKTNSNAYVRMIVRKNERHSNIDWQRSERFPERMGFRLTFHRSLVGREP